MHQTLSFIKEIFRVDNFYKKIKYMILIYNCGPQNLEKSNNHTENHQFFHETQWFFEVFEIIKTAILLF